MTGGGNQLLGEWNRPGRHVVANAIDALSDGLHTLMNREVVWRKPIRSRPCGGSPASSMHFILFHDVVVLS